jgi:hypothetical protein
VSMSSTAPNPTHTSPIPVTVTFSEAVTGFISTDILPTNGTVSNFSGSGSSYTFDLVPSGQGLVSADIAEGVAHDAATNPNTAAVPFSRTFDSQAPTVTFDLLAGSDSGTSDSDNLTNVTSLIIEAAFSKAVSGLTSDDLTNIGSATGCSISVGTPSGNTYPLTLSSCSAGTVIVRLAGSAVTDSAENPNAQTDGPTITIDRSGPTVAMSSLAADPTNTSPIPVTVTFTEVVIGFISSDISPTNGTVGNFSGAGANYSFDLTPTGQDAIIANIGSGVAQDAAGNDNSAAASFSRVYDSQRPTVIFDLQPGSDAGISNTDNITNAASLIFEALFSETVSGFLPADLTNTGTASGCSFSIGVPAGNAYLVTVNSCSAGTVVVRLAENAVTDAAGNQNAQTDSPSVTIDRIAPTVSMSSLTADPINTSPIAVTVTFSEAVNGFISTDVVPTSATVGNFTGSGDSYSFDLTPGGQGLFSADIGSSISQDTAGNGNIAATTFSRVFDSIAPTVGISSGAPNPTNTSPIPVTVTFSESVTGFISTDIVPTNGTVSNFSGSGASYTFDLVPAGQGLVSADIAAGVAQDSATNGNTVATTFSRTYDSFAPTVGMSSGASNPTRISPIPVTVTFSETVTGFISTDIVATNATVSNFSGSGASYSFDLNPAGQGLVSADIAAGAALDSANNGNTAAATFSRTYDSIAPTVTFDLQAGSDSGTSNTDNVTNAASPIIDVIFNEAVTGFTAGDLSNSGTAGGCTFSIGAPTGNTYPVTASSCLEGTLTIRLAVTAVEDAAGNSNAQTTGSAVTIDRSGPSVAMSSTAPNPTGTSPIPVTVVFSEAVTGFIETDLVTANGTVSNFTGSGTDYAFALNPSGQGTVSADIAGAVASDAAGNGNTAATTFSRTYDSVAPVVSFDLQAGSDSGTSSTDNITNAASLVFDASFNKAITGFTAADLTNVGTATGCSLAIGLPSGNIYPVTAASCSAGTVVLRLQASAVIDLAGNPNAQTDGPLVTIDRTPPTVTIDLQAGSDTGISNSDNLTNAASLVFDAAFSEPVGGFTAGDLSNVGTAAGCSFGVGVETGNVFPLTVNSCSAGTLILRIANAGLTDIAGNSIAQTDGPVVTIERTPPTVTFDLQAGSDTGVSTTDDLTNASTLIFDAIFSETVYDLAGTDLTNNGSATSCSFTIGAPSGNTYPVTVTSCSAGTVIPHIATGGVTDAAANMIAPTDGPLVTIDRTPPVFSAVAPVATAFINSITSASDVGYTLSTAISSGSITMTQSGGVADAGSPHTCTLIGTALNSGSHPLFDMSNHTNGCVEAFTLVSNAIYTFQFNGMDAAGNAATPVTNTTVTFDTTPPTITIVGPNVTSTKSGPVTYYITYTDQNFMSNSLSVGDVTLNKTGSANGTVSVVSVSSTYLKININSITGGTNPVIVDSLGISIAAGTASDRAGNLAPAAGPSATFTVDNIAPTLSWVGPVLGGQTYQVFNQSVTLEVAATDNIGIDHVTFYRHCPSGEPNCSSLPETVEIGRVYTSPFRLTFNASDLIPGSNQVWAYSYDAANNQSPFSIIWLYHHPTVTVTKNGLGSGTVSSSPAGINCGSACAYGFIAGTPVTLTAVASPSSVFAGWSGACTGMGTCILTVNENKAVTATFNSRNQIFLPFLVR